MSNELRYHIDPRDWDDEFAEVYADWINSTYTSISTRTTVSLLDDRIEVTESWDVERKDQPPFPFEALHAAKRRRHARDGE